MRNRARQVSALYPRVRLWLCCLIGLMLCLVALDGQSGAAPTSLSTIVDVHYGNRDATQLWAKAQFPSDQSEPMPLLVVLHAWSSDATHAAENALAVFGDAATARGWYIVAPLLHAYTASPLVQRDIVTLVDYMCDKYNVDPERIYITGKSMGGMIAATTAAKYPHRFAALVEEQGPTSVGRWYDEAGAWRQLKLWEEIGGTPAELPFEYQRRSAASMAQNLRNTPVAILHGRQDDVVPVAHAVDFYNALALYQPTHVELHLFDGGHGEEFPGDETMAASPEGILDFLARYQLNSNPAEISIRSDESAEFYWLRISQDQAWATRWTTLSAHVDRRAGQIEATVKDERSLPCTLTIDLYRAGLPTGAYMVEDYDQDTGGYSWERRDVGGAGALDLVLEPGLHVIQVNPWDGRTPSNVILQQGTDYRGVEDTYVHRWNPSLNYGREGEMAVKSGMANGLIRFELQDALPRGTVVRAAQLQLYANFGGGTVQIRAYPLLRPWNEMEATWLQAANGAAWSESGCEGEGQDRESAPYSAGIIESANAWCTLNMRDLVQAWIDHPETNWGVLLKGDAASMYTFLSSQCVWNSGLRPRLEVHAILPPMTPTPTPSKTPTRAPTATPTIGPPPTTTATATVTAPAVSPTRTPSVAGGAIYGLVWQDLNGDHQVGPGEATIANAKVDLLDEHQTILKSQWTLANGLYAFTSLSPGLYCVIERTPPGFFPADFAWTGWVESGALREVNFGLLPRPTPTRTRTPVPPPDWPRVSLPLITRR